MFCCMTQGIQGKYSSLSHVAAAESFVSVNEALTSGLLVINYCLKSFNVYDSYCKTLRIRNLQENHRFRSKLVTNTQLQQTL